MVLERESISNFEESDDNAQSDAATESMWLSLDRYELSEDLSPMLAVCPNASDSIIKLMRWLLVARRMWIESSYSLLEMKMVA